MGRRILNDETDRALEITASCGPLDAIADL